MKKLIQVPIDEELLSALDSISKKHGLSRSELIREACRRYLRQEEYEQMDKLYEEGYKRKPEEPALGEVQTSLVTQILSEEPW